MDLNDIIRSFLGFRRPPGMNDEFSEDGGHFSFFGLPRHPGGAEDDDDDDDDDGNGPFGGRRGGYQHLDEFFNFDKESEAMFRQFEDMFRNFGSSDFHSESAGIPSLDEIPNRNPKSPRDEMLKSPDELHKNEPIHSDKPSHDDRLPSPPGSYLQNDEDGHAPVIKFGEVFRTPWHWNIPALPSTTDKQDKDIDDQIEDGRLGDILKPRQHQQPPSMRSFSKSVSIQTIRKPDGTTETKRTEQDSDGNVTTTVTTSQDGNQETQNMTPSRSCKEPWSRHGWGQHGWPRHKWSRCKPPCVDDEQRQSLSDKLFGPWFR